MAALAPTGEAANPDGRGEPQSSSPPTSRRVRKHSESEVSETVDPSADGNVFASPQVLRKKPPKQTLRMPFGVRHVRSASQSSQSSDGETPVSRPSRSTRFDSRCFIADRVKTEISKRYNIDDQPLGVGGYGQVFIATDRFCRGRTVAIKKLMRDDEERDEALKAEVAIMKDLDHPSICKLFETYTQDTTMYFVIEHLGGGDLCDRVMENRRVDERNTTYILRQIASALRYAHSRHIAHRDMKPENVCFCNNDPECNRVKVIDWGLGKHFSVMRMKSSVGSGAFTAPEVLDPPSEDATYTAACDLWSLGILTYVTLSGKAPFWGGPLQMLSKMRSGTYPMKGAVWDTISDHAKDFIQCLLQANPEQRLSINRLLDHPWLESASVTVNPEIVSQVLSNVEHFSHAPDFLAICVTSLAKQLDHRSLDNVYRVFSRLDTDGNGMLTLKEVRAGFKEVFGNEEANMEEVDEMFSRLDLDGTGIISYTEFCAAGIGEQSYTQEKLLWTAFKAFDIHDCGKITRDSVQLVLQDEDVNKTWSKDVCDDATLRVMNDFAGEDGNIGFEEWLTLMRQCANQFHQESPPKRKFSGDFLLPPSTKLGYPDGQSLIDVMSPTPTSRGALGGESGTSVSRGTSGSTQGYSWSKSFGAVGHAEPAMGSIRSDASLAMGAEAMSMPRQDETAAPRDLPSKSKTAARSGHASPAGLNLGLTSDGSPDRSPAPGDLPPTSLSPVLKTSNRFSKSVPHSALTLALASAGPVSPQLESGEQPQTKVEHPSENPL